jgi:hypothetical protein
VSKRLLRAIADGTRGVIQRDQGTSASAISSRSWAASTSAKPKPSRNMAQALSPASAPAPRASSTRASSKVSRQAA